MFLMIQNFFAQSDWMMGHLRNSEKLSEWRWTGTNGRASAVKSMISSKRDKWNGENFVLRKETTYVWRG